MLDLYPPQKRGAVMAIWGMGVMLGPILGPTLGGYLTDAYNWRWVFYVNRAVRHRRGRRASGSSSRTRTATRRSNSTGSASPCWALGLARCN